MNICSESIFQQNILIELRKKDKKKKQKKNEIESPLRPFIPFTFGI